MVRQSYPGIVHPEEDLAELIPAARRLVAWKLRCSPGGAQDQALARLVGELEAFSQAVAGLPLLHRPNTEGVAGMPRTVGPSVESRAADRARADSARAEFLRRQTLPITAELDSDTGEVRDLTRP